MLKGWNLVKIDYASEHDFQYIFDNDKHIPNQLIQDSGSLLLENEPLEIIFTKKL